METTLRPEREPTLREIEREITATHKKLDHIILQLSDNYYRRFYQLYGPELEG